MNVRCFHRQFGINSHQSFRPLVSLPSSREAHLWYVIPGEVKSSSLLNDYMEILSPSEKANVLSFGDDELKKRALLARTLIRTTIARYHINNDVSPKSLVFKKNSYGKPEVDWLYKQDWNPPPLHFNISHSSSMIACGITMGSAIGIDIEEKNRKIRTNLLTFARRFLSPLEVDILADIPELEVQRQEFIKLWTLKEAYVKALGKGFSASPFNTFSILLKDPRKSSIGACKDSDLRLKLSSTSEVVIEAMDNAQTVIRNWQFALVELAGSQYGAICLEKGKALQASMGNEGGDECERHVTRLLFCGPEFPASHKYTIEYLNKYPDIQVDVLSHQEAAKVIGNYHICVVKMCRMTADIISRAKQMKLIMQFGVGLEGVDIDAATRCGIKAARIPGHSTENAVSCAEMAIYLMFGLLRKQTEMRKSVKLRKLGEPHGETLFGKTVFIMGYGSIGVELAKRLKPFGVKIIATKRSWVPYPQDSNQTNDSCAKDESVDDFVDEKGYHTDIHKFANAADIVVCCLLMNHETVGIVNESFISSMKKGALLVNIARGGLLEYNAVLSNLKSGQLGGLGIDVAWTEPFNPDDPILELPNVLITPHVAGVTEQSYRSMAKVVGDVAIQVHNGADQLTGIEYAN